MPARLSCCAAQQATPSVSPPGEGMAMTMDLRLVLLPAVVIGGFVTWMTLSGPSDAQSEPVSARSVDVSTAPDAFSFNPAVTPTESPKESTMAAPADMAQSAEKAPIDGLKISSQSWRRGGLGSKALVTFTLRNDNDYAVNDIAIACAFTRRDGSHLTDRTRTIHDTVKTKSRRTFARMLIGFVNISANQAKCSLIAANRI
jgi:hypothetical protein